jgi:hypothetical protein
LCLILFEILELRPRKKAILEPKFIPKHPIWNPKQPISNPISLYREPVDQIRAAITNPAFNWTPLLDQATEEHVLPGLRLQFAALGLESLLPADIADLLTAAESLNAERNQHILAEAAYATTLLNQIGIQPVALKGLAYLLAGVYPSPAARYLADIDLLIPAGQLPAAVAHLARHGYFENDSDRFVQFRHHHPGIRRAGLPHIELHHRIGQGICDRLLPAPVILAVATPLTYQGAQFLIPTPTHQINHLILHSQLAHPYHQRIFPPARALLDLANLQSRYANQIDWPALQATYRQNHQSATLLLHLSHAELRGVSPLPLPGHRTILLTLRHHRRQLLNHYPTLRFLDPIYIAMSLFSRRLRLIPQILQNPKTWPHILKALTRPAFYRNLLRL